jgi:hypothetical protein
VPKPADLPVQAPTKFELVIISAARRSRGRSRRGRSKKDDALFGVVAGFSEPEMRQRDETGVASLDHLVGALLQKPRHVEAERFGRLEVDHELKLRWQLYGQV